MTHAQATASDRSIGDYIRDWRQHRRFSQLSLALEIELSQKHLSFIESGRSIPSRELGSLMTSVAKAFGAKPEGGPVEILGQAFPAAWVIAAAVSVIAIGLV